MTSITNVGLPPQQPLRYTGAPVNILTTTQAPRPPTVDDRIYPLNTIWRVSDSQQGGTVGDEWILVDFQGGDAIWRLFSSAGGNGINSLTGDSGGAVFADGAGNVDDLGGTAITTVGTPGSNTLTTNVNYTKQSYVVPVQPSDNFLYYRSSGTAYNTANLSDLLASPRASSQRFENIGATYAAGVYTITAADGSALSATNPGYVCIQSNVTANKFITVALTQPYSFSDATSGGSTIAGNLWGTTTAVAWAVARPYFLYVVCDAADANPQVFLTDSPVKRSLNGNIAKTGSAIATTQADSFMFNNPTVANYANKNTMLLGSLTMTKNTSNDWTVLFAVPNATGIGVFPWGVTFAMVPGQFGAEASKFQFGLGGGTAPSYDTSACAYWIGPDGFCDCSYTLGACTAGTGANDLITPTPYSAAWRPNIGWFIYDDDATGDMRNFQWLLPGGGYNSEFATLDSTGYTILSCNSFANADNNFSMSLRFNAFNYPD